jgi:hypothetical protein
MSATVRNPPIDGAGRNIEPTSYASIKDVPTKQLANNFVGSLIMAKGNLNKYGDLAEMLIRELRGEPHPVQE